jgi:iron complex transport system ATP-binding protein
MSVLSFDGLTVSYGDRQAVAPFTERVESGAWLGIVGPNGAGKSSVLRAVVGLVPSGGTVAIDGRPLGAVGQRERSALVAYVPQEPLIPDDMTVEEYVLLGRTPYISYLGSASRHDRAVAARVIERLDLRCFAERLLGELSGGERQRVVIARALAQEAPVLLMDEPTSALDIGHQQQALELVAELRHDHGLTVVSALHDLTLASTYTDRMTMLHGGVVVASGRAADVLTAERLAEVYRVNVSVEVEADGTVVVVPRRTLRT